VCVHYAEMHHLLRNVFGSRGVTCGVFARLSVCACVLCLAVSLYTCVCDCTRAHVCVHVCVHRRACVCVCVYACVRVCVSTCVYVCVCVCVHRFPIDMIKTKMQVGQYIYMYIYMCVCIYICLCVCMCVYTGSQLTPSKRRCKSDKRSR